MSLTNPRRIHLIGFDTRHEEGVAGGAITPGHLIMLDDTGKYIKNANDGDACEKLFAIEDALQGKSIDDAYATDDVVSFVIAKPGDVVFAFLGVGEACDPGDLLSSNGDGTLRAAASDVPIAVALESKDLSDSDTDADTRIRMRIL